MPPEKPQNDTKLKMAKNEVAGEIPAQLKDKLIDEEQAAKVRKMDPKYAREWLGRNRIDARERGVAREKGAADELLKKL